MLASVFVGFAEIFLGSARDLFYAFIVTGLRVGGVQPRSGATLGSPMLMQNPSLFPCIRFKAKITTCTPCCQSFGTLKPAAPHFGKGKIQVTPCAYA